MNEDKSKLQLIGEIAEANNKNLELIEEINKLYELLDKIKELVNKSLTPNSNYVEYEYGTELLRQEFLELLEEIE